MKFKVTNIEKSEFEIPIQLAIIDDLNPFQNKIKYVFSFLILFIKKSNKFEYEINKKIYLKQLIKNWYIHNFPA